MTELGHGSNVQGIGTTAVYDKATGEFVINTPTDVDRKWWIGHAGRPSFSRTAPARSNLLHRSRVTAHAKNAVVFAQLNVDGQEHGVHAFVVPLRPRDSNATYPGILIGDCGHKMVRVAAFVDQLQFPRAHLFYFSFFLFLSRARDRASTEWTTGG
jgi:acyl-CoA oxidase